MSRIVDDDPPIKTGVTSQAYRDNWDRIFGDDVIEKALRPNESPIIEAVTVRDADTGSELDVTRHEDGSVTVVAERIVTPEQQASEYHRALMAPIVASWGNDSEPECSICGGPRGHYGECK